MAKKLKKLNTDTGIESWEDGDSLPSGTVNKLLRHNGTDWVSTMNTSLSEDTTSAILEFKTPSSTDNNVQVYYSTLGSSFGLSLSSTKYISIFTQATANQLILNTANNEYIWMYADTDNKRFTLRANGASTSQTLIIQSTKTYTPTEKIFEFIGKFEIYQNGKIVSNYLSGSGTSLLEATADGTIQRSATAPTKTKIVTRLSDGAGIQSFTNTDLGITGDLRDKIVGFEILRKWSGGYDLYTSQTGLNHKLLSETELVFSFDNPIPITDTLRLAITYID